MKFKNIILKRLKTIHVLMIVIFILSVYLISNINNTKNNKYIETNFEIKNIYYTYNPESKEYSMHFQLPTILADNIVLLIETDNYKFPKIEVEVDNTVLTKHFPFNLKDTVGYNFYKLPDSFSDKNISITSNLNLEKISNGNIFISISTIENIIISFASDSFLYIVTSVILFIMYVSIFLIFYITKIENYGHVKIFAYLSLILSVHLLIDSPFVSLILNNAIPFFEVYNIYAYMITSIFSTILVYYTIDLPAQRKITMVFIIISILLFLATIFITFYNPFYLKLLIENYFMFMVIFIIYSFFVIIYKVYVEKKYYTMFSAMAIFSFILICNVFYIRRTVLKNVLFLDTIFFTFIILYILFLCFFITSIFIDRRINMDKLEKNLLAERTALNNLHLSGLNNLTCNDTIWLCNKIGSQILQLLSAYNFAFVAYKSIDTSAKIHFTKGEMDYSIISMYTILKDNFVKTQPLTYCDTFDENKAYLSFTSKNDESIYIFIDYKTKFTESERIIAKILCSSILSTFNNSRIYSEISATEKDMLLAIGNVIKSRNYKFGDCELTGELSYILARSYGMNEHDSNCLRLASYIFDIGTIGISDSIAFSKNDNVLSSKEYLEHTIIGYEMLSKLDGLTMEMAAICSLEHHERYDGTGFRRMSKSETSHYSRIISITNNFSIYICENNKHEDSLRLLSEAFMFLSSNKQSIFDPYLVDLFIKQKSEILKVLKNFDN